MMDIRCYKAKSLMDAIKELNECLQHIASSEDWEAWEEAIGIIESVIKIYFKK